VAYVGNQPSRGAWRKLTDISGSFNGVTTTFTTSVPPGTSEYYVTAGTASQLLISVGGVIQQPDVDYTVNTNSITFTTAPAAGLTFFGVLCGDALNTGTPADGSITTAKLAGGLSVGLTAGSASTAALYFTGDANTGLYSPGADQLAITTGGTGRLTIDASGNVNIDSNTLYVDAANNRVGIGTTSPSTALQVIGTGRFGDGTNGIVSLASSGSSSYYDSLNNAATGWQTAVFRGTNITFATDASSTPNERARIDSSGRLLVGTSTARTGFFNGAPVTPNLQLEGTGFNSSSIALVDNENGTTGGGVVIGRSRGTSLGSVTILQSGDSIGSVSYQAADGTDFVEAAKIEAAIDGTPGANDMPGRLVFSTTADGASSPTERMRITSAGNVGIGTASPGALLHAAGKIRFGSNASYYGEIDHDAASTGSNIYNHSDSGGHIFQNGGTERLRIDSSGRLLVGTSTTRTVGLPTAYPSLVQVETTNYAAASLVNNSNDVQPAYLTLGKSRGGIGSNTVVQSGDVLGHIGFAGADGTDLETLAAHIQCAVDGTPGANDMPGRLVFSTTADGASSPTERMRINNVGSIKQQGSGASLENAAGDYNELNIDAAGTTALLQRATNSSFTGVVSVLKTTKAANTNFQFISAEANGAAQFAVRGDGNVSNTNNSYGAISDLKLKENIVDATSQWSDIKALQVRKYNLKEGQTHTQIGLIAQEVELVSPGLVGESPDRDEEGNDLGTVTKAVNYSVLYMKAVKALQEAMERIENLEAKVAALEGV
jgi:hypothetical protein